MPQKIIRAGLILLSAIAIPAAATRGATPRAGDASSTAVLASLDLAFRFATSIQSDPKDQAKAQEAVIRDYLLLGAQEEARKRVEQIRGWRRGALYAQMAEREARQGDFAAARDLIAKAEAVRAETPGWEGPRIGAQIAEALAVLGDVNSSQRLAEELEAADERQYAGQSAATKAQAEAVRGDFEKAMEALHRVDGDADVEIAAGRTRGYLDLAREKGLMPAQRLKALEAGEQSAASLPLWERVGVMTEIAQVHREAGRRERARGMLRKAEEITASLPASSSGMIPLVSELAKGWGRIGDQGKGRALLQQWEPFAAKAIDIDRPGAYSRLSSGRRALGDKKEADRLLLLAVASAESLRNARPRALSAVDICLTLGRDGAEPSAEIRRRLESLLANLKDPW